MTHLSLFATDFDGTLLRSNGTLAPDDLRALADLRQAGCRVILATGRSEFSLKRSLAGRQLPVDWFVLSSGGGIISSDGDTLDYRTLSGEETQRIHSVLRCAGLEDVSIQGPFPHNHKLHWIPGSHGEDFLRRLELYRGHSMEIDSARMASSEVIGFADPETADDVIAEVTANLEPDFSVIRATSPIDHKTVWIEVFPPGVNKATACESIRLKTGISRERTAAVGNDWNDVHMLNWAHASFAVANSPEELLRRHIRVSSNDKCGVAEAAAKWLEMLP